MRIAYLTLEAARNGQASYTHIHEIISGLKRRGWNVDLYQPAYANKTASPGLFLRLMHSFWVQACLWADYRKGTIIYVRSHYLAFITALVAKVLGVPIIHEVNGPYEDAFVTYPALQKFRAVLIPMQRVQYRHASELIAVTNEIAAWLTLETGGKIAHVIPNGANTDLFHPDIPKPKDIPEKYALFFGGLNRWHGIGDIIEASTSTQWPLDTTLIIIGEGPERPSAERAAAEHSHVLYLGKKNYQDIPAYVASALCGLVTITNPQGRSNTGLCPLKLFETLSCGTPAIVTDFPGQADLIRQGDCGIVIPVDSPADIAKAVKILSINTGLRKEMGNRARNLVVTKHSWDKRSQDTHEIVVKYKA